MEKRYFTRVQCAEGASVKFGGQRFFGDVENICLQGLFIKTKHSIPVNTSLDLTVYFSSDKLIHLNADVVRSDDTGVGVKIRKMDVNSFVQLRNAVAKHCNDHGRIMRETYRVTNCIN
jgi:PilZ domain